MSPRLTEPRRAKPAVLKIVFARSRQRYNIRFKVIVPGGSSELVSGHNYSRSIRSIMGSKGFLMRMVPFVAAFALGIFIASFFVNISTPRIGSRGSGHTYHKIKKLRLENERLRLENLRLRNELESGQSNWHDPKHSDGLEMNSEVFLQAQPAPAAPR